MASVLMLKNFFLSFFFGRSLKEKDGMLRAYGSVVFSYSMIYLIGFDLTSFTNPKSNDFLPFSLFESAGAWGPTRENYFSSFSIYYRSGLFLVAYS